MDSIFKNQDAKSCPITKCYLYEPGCGTALDYELIEMANSKPFNISIKSVELGFSKTVCIKCENKQSSRVYDNLKLKQGSRPLDCSNSLSVDAGASEFKDLEYKYNTKLVIRPLDKIFKNEITRCLVS